MEGFGGAEVRVAGSFHRHKGVSHRLMNSRVPDRPSLPKTANLSVAFTIPWRYPLRDALKNSVRFGPKVLQAAP